MLKCSRKIRHCTRPNYVKAVAFNEDMEEYEILEGEELLQEQSVMNQIIWMDILCRKSRR